MVCMYFNSNKMMCYTELISHLLVQIRIGMINDKKIIVSSDKDILVYDSN
jgi:hypothetical protein